MRRGQEVRAEDHLGLVVRAAQRARRQHLQLDDLVAEGSLGLVEAAQRFRPSQGVRFSTYASYWIRHHLSRVRAQLSYPVVLPERQARRARRADGEPYRTCPADQVASDRARGPAARAERAHQQRAIARALAGLSPHGRAALQLIYGLTGGPPRSLRETARVLNLGREGLRAEVRRSLARLAEDPALRALVG